MESRGVKCRARGRDRGWRGKSVDIRFRDGRWPPAIEAKHRKVGREREGEFKLLATKRSTKRTQVFGKSVV